MDNYQFDQTKYKSFLIKFGNHTVFAIIALIVIGTSTRVMEAGLACPDWPLCYGSFLPKTHMNLQVFLEWFHRLDAFLVGVLILIQFSLSLIWRNYLPTWLPKKYSILVFLVILQGSLGALTVINVLDSITVMGHLMVAFLLLITAISINQNLENNSLSSSMGWLKIVMFIPIIFTLIQSIIGVRVSSTWSSHLCLNFNNECLILNIHKLFAIPVSISIIYIFLFSLTKKDLFINNWKFLISNILLLTFQISLGYLSLKTDLSEPLIIVLHQLIASLLISSLTVLLFRNSNQNLQNNLSKTQNIFILNS